MKILSALLPSSKGVFRVCVCGVHVHPLIVMRTCMGVATG